MREPIELYWYHTYSPKRPDMIYGNIIARSPDEALEILNKKPNSGVVVERSYVEIIRLPTEVSSRYREEYF